MHKPILRGFLTLSLLCVATGCASKAKLVERRPELAVSRSTGGSLAEVEETLREAGRLRKHDPNAAIAAYVGAARDAARRLAANPADGAAMRDYNFAVSRMIGTIDHAGLDPWSKPLEVTGKGGAFTIAHRPDKRKMRNMELYRLTPSDLYDVRGEYVSQRTTRDGLGAPVVAAARASISGAREILVPEHPYYGVTVVARFRGNTCEIAIEDPLASETTRFQGRKFPLAADFTVPLAAMLEDPANNPGKQGLTRYFNPGNYDKTARIAGLEPYNPDKTVILVIHGLIDSQATWTPLINTLRGDPEIRENFQFWFFSYPSGDPYPYSATLLRREMDRAFRIYPVHKKIVVLGHSMGGCISRLLITDTGEKLWRGVFSKAPGETELTEEARKILTETLIFEHRPEVGRVVFLSAPLKGSKMASNWLGRIGSALSKKRKILLAVGKDARRSIEFEKGDLKLKHFPDSVDTLAPNNRFVKAINTIPVTPEIPHHVVAGDRGKGDAPDSSDGVVPYWSSHMETAESEKIIPWKHGTHQHPEGIAEVARILKMHARTER